MPKIVRVRAPQDEKEEKQVRKLAGSRHGPADWILHARMVARSWDGQDEPAFMSVSACFLSLARPATDTGHHVEQRTPRPTVG